VAAIFLRGPQYTGNFTAESPLTDHLPAWACHVLCTCDVPPLPADDLIKLLGFRGLEGVVDPPADHGHHHLHGQSPGQGAASADAVHVHVEVPALPPPLLAYSAVLTASYQLTQEEVWATLGSAGGTMVRPASPAADEEDDDGPPTHPRAAAAAAADAGESDGDAAAAAAAAPPKVLAVGVANGRSGPALSRAPAGPPEPCL